jgi:hypothetical protein
VRVRIQEEFELICQGYLINLKIILCDAPEFDATAEKTFHKAGLASDDEKTYVGDPERWVEVSMLQRVAEEMPPATNALESTNGHLNE